LKRSSLFTIILNAYIVLPFWEAIYNVPSLITGLRCPLPTFNCSDDVQFNSGLIRGPDPSDALVFEGFCPNIVQLLVKGINFTFPSSILNLSLISISILSVELNESIHLFSLVCQVTPHLKISGVTDESLVVSSAFIFNL